MAFKGCTTHALPFEARSHHTMTDGSLHWGYGDCDRTYFIAAIDDLAGFVGADIATIARLHDGFTAAGDDRKFAGEHVIDLFRWRSIRPGAAAGQKVRNPEDQGLLAAHLRTKHA